jgi:hypothetical protein
VNKNTVKPGLTPKRDKRSVENPEFVSFARRILNAYARRIASGDIEALRAMNTLTSDVDTATRVAVQGLREFGYSWADIAARLGVTRQAAQMRYGEPSERDALDDRLTSGGLGVTVTTLVAVFVDHHPGNPAGSTCPGCGYVYRSDLSECPTYTFVRRLLRQRRHENPRALHRLTSVQAADLVAVEHTSRARRAQPELPPQDGLFDLFAEGVVR